VVGVDDIPIDPADVNVDHDETLLNVLRLFADQVAPYQLPWFIQGLRNMAKAGPATRGSAYSGSEVVMVVFGVFNVVLVNELLVFVVFGVLN
jgi:hypothetical protein